MGKTDTWRDGTFKGLRVNPKTGQRTKRTGQFRVGDELVHRHLRTENLRRGHRFAGADPQQPRYRRERDAQDFREREFALDEAECLTRPLIHCFQSALLDNWIGRAHELANLK